MRMMAIAYLGDNVHLMFYDFEFEIFKKSFKFLIPNVSFPNTIVLFTLFMLKI